MSYFALLWKARAIERYRLNYEQEKLNSIRITNSETPKLSLLQKIRHYRYDTRKKAGKSFQKWCPRLVNMINAIRTDQTFPNFVWKSVIGFVGGILLTYLCFMFFVFQLAISLVHATIMSSIIGVLLTLGLAFSYRVRCLVFLLIPQFFSRVGRYTLTCYALVLILTGPATNTLRNSEILSESLACGQEQVKTSVRQITESIKKPFNSLKDTITVMINNVKQVAEKFKDVLLKLHRLILSIVRVLQSAFSWLSSIVGVCNKKVGTPYVRCTRALSDGVLDCQAKLGPYFSWLCNVVYVAHAACIAVKPLDFICILVEFVSGSIVDTIKRKLRTFSNHVKTMLYVSVHVHHSYYFSSNSSKSASQVAAGIVTEIRHRAEPLLTWLSWSSCVTSLFLLLIIFRAKYYQHMFDTRSRFDNRYVTKEMRALDLKRVRENRDTILPLNRRERSKYINTTSLRLVASEKVYLTRSLIFMCITTFKLLIHIIADYSLYWVLMTIRHHGRFQSPQLPGVPDAGVQVAGQGPVAGMMRSLVDSLSVPLATPAPSPASCLPNPYPPDLQRYTQIGVLIFLLWFFALFEPYGLRLRHVIMGHYRPERAKARAVWLYNHILRTRGGFLKLARRKLHRDYKYSSEHRFTFRQWLDANIPCWWLRAILRTSPNAPHCLLCDTIENTNDPDTQLVKCETTDCPGIFCMSCFSDIGQLCTICLSPSDYGDISDISLERGSSEDSLTEDDTSDTEDSEDDDDKKAILLNPTPPESETSDSTTSSESETDESSTNEKQYTNDTNSKPNDNIKHVYYTFIDNNNGLRRKNNRDEVENRINDIILTSNTKRVSFKCKKSQSVLKSLLKNKQRCKIYRKGSRYKKCNTINEVDSNNIDSNKSTIKDENKPETSKVNVSTNELKEDTTQDKWIRHEYEKEVGLNFKNKEKKDALVRATIDELQVVAEKTRKSRKIVIWKGLPEENPKTRNVCWPSTPKPIRCHCPVTKCICIGTFEQSRRSKLPRLKNIYRGGSSYLRSYLLKINAPQPAGTFLKQLETYADKEIKFYENMDKEGTLKRQGPEDCLSRCPHFYSSYKTWKERKLGRTEYVDKNTGEICMDSSVPSKEQMKSIKIEVSIKKQEKLEQHSEDCQSQRGCICKIKKTGERRNVNFNTKIDEASFQDLIEDKPLSDGISVSASTQTSISLEDTDQSSDSEHSVCEDLHKRVPNCYFSFGYRLKRRLFCLCEWLFNSNHITETEVEAKPECSTKFSQYSDSIGLLEDIEKSNRKLTSGGSGGQRCCQYRGYCSCEKKPPPLQIIRFNKRTNENGCGVNVEYISENTRKQVSNKISDIGRVKCDDCDEGTISSEQDWWSPMSEKKKGKK